MARTFQNHHLKWSVLLLLIAAADGLSQQPLLYYCGDPNHVYLWVDPAAQAAVVTRQDDHWATPPDAEIRKQLGEIKPGPPDAAIQFLCQSQPDTPVAHPRYPDREIDLRKQADGTVRLSFLTPANSPTFSFNRGDKVNIPLAKLLNEPTDADAATILNHGSKPDMKTFWASWMDAALQSTQPFQHVYLDDAQKPQWLWAEAIPESHWINRMHRPMPAPIAAPVEKRIEVPVIDWFRAALFLVLGVLIGAGGVFALRRQPAPRDDHLIQEIDIRLKSLQSDLVSRMESLGNPPRDPQQATDTDLRLKKEASAQIRNLLAPLRTAQTNYLDGFRDPPSSAMLAFLISHSLLQLSLGLLDGDENGVRAMKANLTSICRKLSPLQIPGFQKTLEQLEKQQWNVEGLTDKMVRTDDHRDAGVFQVVLKYLRDYQKLDLAPFYITVDENGLAYRAN